MLLCPFSRGIITKIETFFHCDTQADRGPEPQCQINYCKGNDVTLLTDDAFNSCPGQVFRGKLFEIASLTINSSVWMIMGDCKMQLADSFCLPSLP